MLNDPNAIQHVMNGQTTTYHLEESLREFLRLVTGMRFITQCFGLPPNIITSAGKGIIYADGETPTSV